VASDERDRLLAATVDYALEHGIGDVSLRQLADAIGTSHRMLVYYFGSKDELLVEVTKAVEQEQRDGIALVIDGVEDLGAQWRRLTDPSMWPQERLFFELYAQALQGHAHASALLDGVVDDWLEPLTALAIKEGVPKGRARADARLALAVTRGLLLDLLATGDRKGVNAAMARFAELRAGGERHSS
jgi:AcrR family transcriptional regulator